MNSSSNQFVWPVRVYYEDTDSGGVVYYANYLKFMERARTEWLRSIGYEQDQLLAQDGIIFAVRSIEVGYHQPARFNDALEVSASLSGKGRASLTFQQEVRRPADSQLLCSGEIKIACVDMKRMRPTPIPTGLLLEIPDVD
ncbi:MAG: tol-pal system-associated acyl-CoA thioesterase [Candidatus Thiodiazotropha sp. (ex Gloverina cf. vestifex)]|nr:tol-pal system-associated acyl-CoA thioesterase [Candidatus Thiodiazotropha sp. (ex Gloverina cf. vestifex)]